MTDLAELILALGIVWMVLASLLASAVLFLFAVRGHFIGPLAVMTSVPVQRSLVLDAGTVSLTVTQMLLWAFLAGALLRFARGRLKVRMDLVTILSFALVMFYGISVIQSQNIGAWAGENYRWASAALFLLFARSYFSEQSSRPLLWTLVGLCAVSATWAALQIALDTGPASFSRNGVMRAYGAFGEPNPFAAFCVALSLPVIGSLLLQRNVSRHVRLWVAFGAMSGLTAVLLAQSRGAILGLAIGCLFLGMVVTLRLRTGARSVVWVGGALITAAAIVMIVDQQPWNTGNTAVTPASWANAEREAHWATAFAMVSDKPVSGVGAGGFNDSFRDATTEWRFRIPRGHAHNAYLHVASEAGVFALVVYIGFLGAVAGSVWRRMRLDSCDWLRWGVLAVTLAMIVHQMFDYLQVLSIGILYGGLWAAVLGVNQVRMHVPEHNGTN